MKTKLYKAFLVLAIAAMVPCVSACGTSGGGGQAAPAPNGAAETGIREGNGAAPGGPEEAAPEEQALEMEQYKDMAEKFALYCEYVYFDYQESGIVTINGACVEEDTESQCRITVYNSFSLPSRAGGCLFAEAFKYRPPRFLAGAACCRHF